MFKENPPSDLDNMVGFVALTEQYIRKFVNKLFIKTLKGKLDDIKTVLVCILFIYFTLLHTEAKNRNTIRVQKLKRR